MLTKEIIGKLKEGFVWIILGALLTVIPFYYETNSSLAQVSDKVEVLTVELDQNKMAVSNLQSSQLVAQERLKNIETRLERIEQKLDYLIENDR